MMDVGSGWVVGRACRDLVGCVCVVPGRWSSLSRPREVPVCRVGSLVELVETSWGACVSCPVVGRACRDLVGCVCVVLGRWSSLSRPGGVRVCRARSLVELVETWWGACVSCSVDRRSGCVVEVGLRGLDRLDRRSGWVVEVGSPRARPADGCGRESGAACSEGRAGDPDPPSPFSQLRRHVLLARQPGRVDL
jgi:hypothetical protein